jgi:uncharacterized protein (TIGR03382 family)
MSFRSTFAASSAVAVAMVALAGQAQASFGVTFNGISPSSSVSISTNSGSSYNNTTAGKNNFTGDTNAPEDLKGSFSGFCIQLNQGITNGNTYNDFNVTSLALAPTPGTAMGTAKAALVSELWGRFYSGLNSSTKYAAFQVAIWEIVTDSGLSLTGGTFRAASSSVRTQAQTYLNALNGSGPLASLQGLTSSTRQDFVVPMTQIPAPGVATLALAGLALVSRRRR